jgi:hypothetical protein
VEQLHEQTPDLWAMILRRSPIFKGGNAMAKAPRGTAGRADYSKMIPLSSILPINTGLSSATEHTMVSILGSPRLPLTTRDQPKRASDLVKKLRTPAKITDHISVEGIRPAVESLTDVLKKVFEQEPDLKNVLGTEGMLNVRYRKPTSGRKSTQVSNHSWGTAIDFKIVGKKAPGNTGGKVPKFVAVMIPFFNKAGWFSGIAFHDTMHFEVADETIRKWSKQHLLDAA